MGEHSVNAGDTDEEKLDRIADTLNQLPRKERSLRERITYLSPSILQALEKGYSYQAVTEILKEQGITISASTLKQYLYKLRQDATKAEPHPEENLDVDPELPQQEVSKNRRFVTMPKEL